MRPKISPICIDVPKIPYPESMSDLDESAAKNSLLLLSHMFPFV